MGGKGRKKMGVTSYWVKSHEWEKSCAINRDPKKGVLSERRRQSTGVKKRIDVKTRSGKKTGKRLEKTGEKKKKRDQTGCPWDDVLEKSKRFTKEFSGGKS